MGNKAKGGIALASGLAIAIATAAAFVDVAPVPTHATAAAPDTRNFERVELNRNGSSDISCNTRIVLLDAREVTASVECIALDALDIALPHAGGPTLVNRVMVIDVGAGLCSAEVGRYTPAGSGVTDFFDRFPCKSVPLPVKT